MSRVQRGRGAIDTNPALSPLCRQAGAGALDTGKSAHTGRRITTPAGEALASLVFLFIRQPIRGRQHRLSVAWIRVARTLVTSSRCGMASWLCGLLDRA